MAEEKHIDIARTNSDDLSALRTLLHTIKGLSLVSSTQYLTIPLEEE